MTEPADLAALFRRFAERECEGVSPLYAALSRRVSEDEEVLRLAARAQPGQPPPNMLFAAVHALLLAGADDPLAHFYPDLSEAPLPPEDAFSAFKAFCRARETEIAALLTERVVSTNEAQRSACLMPALALAAARGGEPLHLVEVGASAGLNLIWDCYAYDYGDAGQLGDPEAPLRLTCTVSGAPPRLPLPARLPRVGRRIGIDPYPLDLRQPDDRAWLRALIWPEQHERAQRLEIAARLVADAELEILRGDANDLMPAAVAGLPADGTLCVYHSFTLNQFDAPARTRFAAILAELGQQRQLYQVGLEWGEETAPCLSLTTHNESGAVREELARCDAHGQWIEWAASE